MLELHMSRQPHFTGRHSVRSLLSPWYSTQNLASVLVFCWTDHGIWHSGGICTEYNGNCVCIIMSCNSVQSPTPFHEKKLKSMDGLVDFHGTSPRSSREIIHVMISHVRTKQTMFVWRLAHQTWPTLFFPPPSSHHHQPCSSPVTAANHALYHHRPLWPPMNANNHQWPHCHHECLKNKANHPQTKTATHIRTTARERWPAAMYGHGQQWAKVNKLTSPLIIISLPQVPCCWQWCGNQTTHHNKGTGTTTSWDNDEEGRGQRHGEDTQQWQGTRDNDEDTQLQGYMTMAHGNDAGRQHGTMTDGASADTNDPPPSPSSDDKTTMTVMVAMLHENWQGCTTTTIHKRRNKGTPPPPMNNATSAQPLHPWKMMRAQQHHLQLTTRDQHHPPMMMRAQHHKWQMRAQHHLPWGPACPHTPSPPLIYKVVL